MGVFFGSEGHRIYFTELEKIKSFSQTFANLLKDFTGRETAEADLEIVFKGKRCTHTSPPKSNPHEIY